MNHKKGFSLIELMIVTVILGILTAVAIPAYQDYIIRARVIEGLSLAIAAKLLVSETAITHNQLPANQAETGYQGPPRSENVAFITIGANGVITITYTPAASGGTLLLTPTLQPNGGEVTWDCKAGGTLLPKYRPAECRA